MLVLMLKTLRYHTFNKFFFIAAVMLFFCGSRDAQYKSGSSSVTVLAYGILFVIGTVFLNINNENRSGGYRNALTAGFTKRQVFFAHIISSAVCGAALFLFIAFPIYTSLRSSKTFMAILMIYILSAVVTACIHLNITNVTAAFAVVAIVVVLCIVVTKPAQDMLGEDRYYYDVVFDDLSMVAQLVKNPPAMQETWVRSLGWEDSWEEGMATHSSIPARRILRRPENNG